MYGPGTDPTPFLAAAFVLGAISIFGFSIWIIVGRQNLRNMLAAIKGDKKEHHDREQSA